MLLLFEVDGYKLFDHKIQFSMFPNRRIKKLKENIVVKTINNKEYHVLKSAIIYGPNNSGKTTFIKSLSLFKSIIEQENVDSVSQDKLNFNFFDPDLNIDFKIEFLSNKKHYSYELSFNDKKQINNEVLIVDGETILNRFGKNNKCISHVIDLLGHYENKLLVLSLPREYEEVYKGFKKFFSKLIVLQHVDENIQSTFDILEDPLYKEDFIRLIRNSDTNIKDVRISKDINREKFSYVPKEVAEYLRLESTYEKNGQKISFPSILVDSLGTKKLIVYASYILKALKENYVLVIDELDSSWHTVLTRNIFALFNSVSNTSSQLIASSHDLLLLDDENMFRRDQIWFTYKDIESIYFYSLNDFRAEAGKKSNALTNYLKGKYGALPYPEIGDLMNEKE